MNSIINKLTHKEYLITQVYGMDGIYLLEVERIEDLPLEFYLKHNVYYKNSNTLEKSTTFQNETIEKLHPYKIKKYIMSYRFYDKYITEREKIPLEKFPYLTGTTSFTNFAKSLSLHSKKFYEIPCMTFKNNDQDVFKTDEIIFMYKAPSENRDKSFFTFSEEDAIRVFKTTLKDLTYSANFDRYSKLYNYDFLDCMKNLWVVNNKTMKINFNKNYMDRITYNISPKKFPRKLISYRTLKNVINDSDFGNEYPQSAITLYFLKNLKNNFNLENIKKCLNEIKESFEFNIDGLYFLEPDISNAPNNLAFSMNSLLYGSDFNFENKKVTEIIDKIGFQKEDLKDFMTGEKLLTRRKKFKIAKKLEKYILDDVECYKIINKDKKYLLKNILGKEDDL